MNENTITLLIMCKDEFTKVKNIIKSIENHIDEVIIVVTGDTTVSETGFFLSASKNVVIKVLSYTWHDDYSAPLNAGLRLCTSKWILRLDTDEEVDSKTIKKISQAVVLPNIDAFEVIQRGYLPNHRKEFGVKRVSSYKNYNSAVDDICVRLFKNDPRIFFEFNTHETLYNSIKRGGFSIKRSNIILHHWGKLTMDKKAPYYYKIALERLRRYPEDYQSYYYVGVAADFIGKMDVAYDAFKKGYEKYKTTYYKIPLEFVERKRRMLNGR